MRITDGNGKVIAEHPARWLVAFKGADAAQRRTLVRAIPTLPSGGWRHPLTVALNMAEETGSKTIAGTLATRLGNVDPASVYDPARVKRCSGCGRLGSYAFTFGPRMDRTVKVPIGDAEALAEDFRVALVDTKTCVDKVTIRPIKGDDKHVKIAGPRVQNACRCCRRAATRKLAWVPAPGRIGASLPDAVGEYPRGYYADADGTPVLRADGSKIAEGADPYACGDTDDEDTEGGEE